MWPGDAIGPSVATAPWATPTLHCCASGCSGAHARAAQAPGQAAALQQSLQNTKYPQTQTTLEQTGMAGNNQPATASSSRGGSGHPFLCSPGGLQSLVRAEPAPQPARLLPSPCLHPACASLWAAPVVGGQSNTGPQPSDPTKHHGPGAWLREEAAAQRGCINAG